MEYCELAQELAEINKTVLKLSEYRKLSDPHQGEGVLLGYLRRHGQEATPAELSAALQVSTARIAALLNKMERKGLVKREKHPENGRNTAVRLLPEGKNLSEKQEEAFNQKVVDFFETLGEEKAVLFVQLQREMAEFMMRQSTKAGERSE